MTEKQIIDAISDACKDDTLRFQIIIQDGVLYVYINRPADAELDYQTLEGKIQAVFQKVEDKEFQEIALYSRILGETEPDWQSLPDTEISKIDSEQISSMMSAITDAVEATKSIVSRIERELTVPESLATSAVDDFEELPTTAEDKSSQLDLETLKSIDSAVWRQDLKQFCFIRNQRLLYAVLAPPKENIAQLIDLFHLFGEPIQRSQMPILEQYFEQSIMPDLDIFESEVQSWWTAVIMLDSDQKRQFSIWLSRYCIHPEQTMGTINEVFQPNAVDDADLVASDEQKTQDFNNLQPDERQKFSLINNFKNIFHRFWGDRQTYSENNSQSDGIE